MDEDSRLCRTYIAAMEILAKPWNGMLMAVLEDGPLRFSELAERVPAIGDRMLAARLKELEARSLVRRTVEHGPPVRVSYELTTVGHGFHDVAAAMSRWGQMIIDGAKSSSASRRPSASARRGPPRAR